MRKWYEWDTQLNNETTLTLAHFQLLKDDMTPEEKDYAVLAFLLYQASATQVYEIDRWLTSVKLDPSKMREFGMTKPKRYVVGAKEVEENETKKPEAKQPE
ncbi:MAG: hypothetical protein JRN26_05960 [Nitrososphaerota archaeon]|nr:hypothetical protein [Nitrososphaerota archaeon]MDG6926992.1 hypothetical protein [Nitrososphaerota archaeon]MDG6930447.1 hypothetical protein [Nitrososphaerota archaeon]MDG6931488.1 hypothetical protein [Nitrososphaerota archaeon]MDG6936407.1 hypothetical protein [Nitrososphaerota archaeon]